MKINFKKMDEKFNNVEFFVVCIFPTSTPSFSAIPANLKVVHGDNFWMISSLAGEASLLHQVGDKHVMFRGYELETSVHSYSPPHDIAKLAEHDRLVNGVFSLIEFDPTTGTALVRTDALGFSPLFYREENGCYLFSSHASLIHKKSDKVDLVSWLSLMQNSFNFGDNSFYENIKRFPGGRQWTLTRDGKTALAWFDRSTLPAGEKIIDDASFVEIEEAYQQSFEKCLALKSDAITLPFSSGFDSRRFFAGLQRRNLPFKAITCQTFHRKQGKDYDIDSHFAPKIAAQFGVQCELVKAASNSAIQANNQRRMSLIGTETFMHEWALPLMDWLARRPSSLVFDGLAGDTLGNSGYEFDGLHETPEKDLQILVKQTIKPEFFNNLSSIFPSFDRYKKIYSDVLSAYPATLNRAELVFLEFRTRRCISPWITMMHPPGQVVVFPYCDMGFVRATMGYNPAEKYKWFFQKECLKRFYPEYFDFHGSRNLPQDFPARPAKESQEIDLIRNDLLYSNKKNVFSALKYLNFQNKLLLIFSAVFPKLRKKRDWIIRPVLSLVDIDRNNTPFLE